MTGRLSGLITWTKEVVPESKSMHCAIHKQMLESRKMLLEFTNVLNDVVKVIKRIKHMPLARACLGSFLRRWT